VGVGEVLPARVDVELSSTDVGLTDEEEGSCVLVSSLDVVVISSDELLIPVVLKSKLWLLDS
jgi:hypothetical protein